MSTRCHRRDFAKAAMLGAGLVILGDSRSVGSYRANQKLDIAIVGACGQGESNTNAVAGENLVALCDVDERRADETHKRFPKTKRYADFRKMLDEIHGQIDAVVVSTPDHTHAVVAAAAMKHGKHVYCEKPLCRTVHEARTLRDLAARHKVVTQMGNQGSAAEALRRAVELAWAGTAGVLGEAHIWLAGGNGPQERPKD
ncbi:MAG: Gfo/Idh/MocA family oxidoreductase, partial [Thermoguttaceae bacterium]|nr:Gfo/Idh/MocA family oxidoreductase [Thermoguttaceae bacterium]